MRVGPALAALALALATRAEGQEPAFQIDFSDPKVPPIGTLFEIEQGTGAPELPGWGNNEAEYYTSSNTNLFVRDGALHIRAILKDPARPGGEGPTSARIVTRKGLLPTFGRYEIRARAPCGRGYWPALWMLGEQGGWPERGEIDIFEWSGKYFSKNEMQSALHSAEKHGAAALVAHRNLKDACGAFHIYELLWTPDRVGFGVDKVSENGMRIFKKPREATTANWPFIQPFQLILNLAVGGDLGGETMDVEPVADFEITWIKVYPVR